MAYADARQVCLRLSHGPTRGSMLRVMAFGTTDYDPIRPGMIRSAATVVPEVMAIVAPETVVDVGCGQGVWLAEFARHGCQVHGFDGHDSPVDISAEEYTQVDLERVPALWGHYDLAVCLEVAEHLPESRADWLVRTLTDLADVVLFSAAIPGQGGQNHVNEQWPNYWAERFVAEDYLVSGGLRWKFWGDVPEKIEQWYAQNLLLCVRGLTASTWPDRKLALFAGDANQPWPVVHPRYWPAR